MDCPRQDGNLFLKTIPKPGDMLLEYSVCSTCHGIWLRAFDANFLKTTDIENLNKPESSPRLDRGVNKPEPPTPLTCPTCGFTLTRATGANLPDDVLAFRCPHGHGYFFPAGELSKFKAAQTAKIDYYQTWKIPLPSIASTLLTALVGIVLSVGLVLGVISGQQQQTIVSQAQKIISFQKAYVAPATKSVTVIAGTSSNTTLTIHINQINYSAPLQTGDQKSHVIRITKLASGNYDYYFTFEIEGKTLRSETYSFVIE